MHYVYILRSISVPDNFYVGETTDLRRRFEQHNARSSSHTAKDAPWTLQWYAAFKDTSSAKRFEAYLKSGSGRAFARKHF